MAASVAQLVEHRSRKAGVTGSSPVAGSIAQDSRLRAAFLLSISGAHPPIQAQRRRQLPYSTKSLADRNPQRNRNQRGPRALLQGITLTTRTAQPSSALLLPVGICKQLKADLLDRLRTIARELERGHVRLAGNEQRELVVGKIAGDRSVGIDQVVVVLLVKLLDQRQAARSDLKGLATLDVDLQVVIALMRLIVSLGLGTRRGTRTFAKTLSPRI